MLLLTLFFPLLPLGLAACQLLSASSRPKREEGLDSAAGRLSLLLLLRRGAMLALLTPTLTPTPTLTLALKPNPKL